MTSKTLAAAAAALVVFLGGLLSGCAAGQGTVADAVETLYASASVSDVEAATRQARDAAILEWGAEEQVIAPFSAPALQSAYDADAAEGARYGAQTLSFWNYYTEFVDTVAQQLRDGLRQELTEADARAYYDAHPADFARQDTMTVRITEWEGTRAVGASELDIDADTVRMLQEAHDLAISAALALRAGEQVTVDRGDGRQALIECLTRESGGTYPFDDVMQAAAVRAASDIFESELRRRIAAAHP
ncbi:hypothetical protein JOD62_002311 [Microbacterium keratanolyticum]|uniref:Uncharacterized protein n=1 Tax=Microbacterium keratanolyticum TaxID=67574 RepID=A0A9W6HS21_9MICO|nr:hypothetical protein [Microbacterium keratanolyticum]MBM7469763.1 hypothetical protein [Microbacterium keratanolyticum]GLK01841.1 hypothetical protein GCM10017596_15560 [Microbacterium keratanolyticum]